MSQDGLYVLAMLNVEKVMTAYIINFNYGVIDKSTKRKEGKMGFLYKWNSKWSNKLLKGIFIICLIKIKTNSCISLWTFLPKLWKISLFRQGKLNWALLINLVIHLQQFRKKTSRAAIALYSPDVLKNRKISYTTANRTPPSPAPSVVTTPTTLWRS